MIGETSSFVDRFHYRKAENGLYCKGYVLPDVTPYSLVYMYIPDTYTVVEAYLPTLLCFKSDNESTNS